MSRVLPIMFNTEMVKAILDGRKTVTRRIVKYKYGNTEMKMRTDKYGTRLIEIQKDVEGETHGRHPDGSTWHRLLPYIEKKPPYHKDDILYVRETWCKWYCYDCGMDNDDGTCNAGRKMHDQEREEYFCYGYRANDDCDPFDGKWKPSIHMPKEAARIFLKVTDVRVERLHDITEEDARSEGCIYGPLFEEDGYEIPALNRFPRLWNSTIKKSDEDAYGWDANPWVWIIEFERCERPVIDTEE